MIESHYRSYDVKLSPKRDGDLLTCLAAMGLCGKNIANVTTFLIKQVQKAYRWQGKDAKHAFRMRESLHPLQATVITFLNEQIDEYNRDQDAKRHAKKTAQAIKLRAMTSEEAQATKVVATFTPLRRFGAEIDKVVHDQILDGKFLYFAVKKWDAQQAAQNAVAVPDTQALPGALAQNIVCGVRDDFLNHYKALGGYRDKPEAFTGRPREPGYLGKNSHKTLSVDMAQIHGKLIESRKPVYFMDYARTKPLPAAALAAYKAVDVHAWVEQVRIKHKLKKGSEAEQLRVVCSGNTARVEIVFSIPVELAPHCLIGQIDQFAHDTQWYSKKTPDFLSVLAKRSQRIGALAQQLCRDQNLGMAGADLGMTNLVAIGYHVGHPVRGAVITSKQYVQRIKRMDMVLDAIKSRQTPEAVKVVQRRQADGEKVSKEDRYLLQVAYRELYASPAYLQAMARKTAFVQDTVHKMSHWIVDQLVAKKVQLLVIGKNDGWKNNANIGRIKNREFHNFPHARFIDVLRYKAFESGVLVLTAEEAYTSKSSFINNGILPAHGDKQAILAQANQVTENTVASPSATPIVRLRDLLGGVRGSRLKRHHYTSRLLNKKITLHADLNAAMNMMRKVCGWLRFDPLRHALRANIVGLCWSGFDGSRKEQFALICR
jgi:IS605 OrfB family transposase